MVEYITLHMGSANNYYPEVFLDVFLFVFHLLTWMMLFLSGAISDGSVGKDQSCFGEKYYVSMICNCRRILCFYFLLFSPFFSPFSIYIQNQKIDKKSELTQEEKLSIL